jgi:hypothetical protein
MRLRKLVRSATIALSLAPGEAWAQGCAGESCTAASDCLAELRCLDNRCVTKGAFVEARPSGQDIGYLGFVLGAGIPTIWTNVGEAAQAALRIGTVFHRFQFQLEVAPGSTVLFNQTSSTMGLLDVVGSVGLVAPLSDMVSWVFRVGGGGGFVYGAPTQAFCQQCGPFASTSPMGELRLDLVNVAIRTAKHVLIEASVPSFRLLFPTEGNLTFDLRGTVMLMWVTTVAVSYVF